MQITYELTEKDFTESFAAHGNRRTWVKWVRYILFYLILLLTAVLLFGSIRSGNTKAFLPTFGLLILSLLLVGGLPMSLSARRQFLKQPGAHGTRTVLLDDAGAHWRWNGGSSDIEWNNYIRSLEGRNHFLLYTSPACFNIVPKRALSAEELEEFRGIVKQHVPAVK